MSNILENEQLDDAKMLRLKRNESPGTGESPELKLPTHVMSDTDSLRVRI